MEKKVTKKEMFAMVREVVMDCSKSAEEINAMLTFLDHEVELLTKKSQSKSKKETANDLENARLMGVIVDTLATVNGGITVSDLMAKNSELGNLSNQKVSALMKKLVDAGKVSKAVEKGKSFFSLA